MSDSSLRLVERDYRVFREIERWRVCTSKHIFKLGNFSSQRTCDRRLLKLVDNKFLERQKILYGLPYLYQCTHKSKILINVSPRKDKIKLEQIHHDIITLDVAIFLNENKGIAFNEIITEKQLHMMDGFNTRKHRPDFVIDKEQKRICVEIELTLKSKSRLTENIKSNFLEYDEQIWIVPNIKSKIANNIKENCKIYTDISIISLEQITGTL